MTEKKQYGTSLLDWCTKDQKSINALMEYIEELADDRAWKGKVSLNDEQKEKSVALIIAALDDPTEWFINLEHLDVITRYLAQYMLTNDKEQLDSAWSLIKRFAIDHFEESIDKLVDMMVSANHVSTTILSRCAGGAL